MSQIPYRVNLSAAIFPMTIAKAGRTVINPGADQNFDRRVDPPGDNSKNSVGIPQVMYMENVVPTPDGYQSAGILPEDVINGFDLGINCVIPIKLATVENNTEIIEDIDITDTGDTIEDWNASTLVNFQLAYPHDSTTYPSLGESNEGSCESLNNIYYREVAESTVEGSPSANCYRLTNYTYFLRDVSVYLNLIPLYTAQLLRNLNVTNSNSIVFNFRTRFKSGTLYDTLLDVPVAGTYKKLMNVVIANNSSMAGLRITYNSMTGNLAIASSDGTVAQKTLPEPIFSAPLTLAFDTWYRFEVTVTLNSDSTRTVEVTAKDEGGTTLTTLLGIISSSIPKGEVCGFVFDSLSKLGYDGIPVEDPDYFGFYRFAPDKIYFDEIVIQADVADESFVVSSGVVNAYLSFFYDNTVTASYNLDSWDDSAVTVPIDFESPESEDKISVANVRGTAYVCIRRSDNTTKIYTVTTPSNVFTFTDITSTVSAGLLDGYTIDDIIGITGSYNYLILLTTARIFWSSTISPTDFAESLITGAGSDIPGNLAGDVVFAKSHTAGFYIYTRGNVLFAQYTGNARYPWKFREIAGSGGYLKSTQVAGDTNTSVQIGVNLAKNVQSLGPDAAELIAPEVSDYLERGHTVDEFNRTTNVFTTSYLANLGFGEGNHRVWFYLDKYIFVPCLKPPAGEGGEQDMFDNIVVFDTLLKRYGRIKLECSQILSDDKSIYFITYTTGQIYKLEFDLYNFDMTDLFSSVLILGKFEYVRNRFIDLEEIEIESVQNSVLWGIDPEFFLVLLPTLDGKTFTASVTPTLVTGDEFLKRYKTHISVKNVSLCLKGAFDVSSIELLFHVGGRL